METMHNLINLFSFYQMLSVVDGEEMGENAGTSKSA